MTKTLKKRYLISLTIREYKSKLQWDTTSYSLGWLLPKNKIGNNKHWLGYGEIGTLLRCWGQCNWCSHGRKQYGKSSKRKKKIGTTVWFSYSCNLGYYLKTIKTLIWKDVCTLYLLQHYLQLPRYGNNLCLLMDEWIKKMWCVCIYTGGLQKDIVS